MCKEMIVLASGGLDSTTIIYELLKKGLKPKPIFYNYGQHCADQEWRVLNEVIPKGVEKPEYHDISSLFTGSNSRLINEADLWSEDVEDNDLYVPYRTLIFLTCACARAQSLEISEVYAGFINSNHAKEIDCSFDFLNGIGNLTEHIGPVKIILPLKEMSKTQVLSKAIDLEVPIGKTFSCQAQSKLPCGACPNCVERLAALRELGLQL
ncbi:7-cyano-7-deazaguanine synthase [Pantoea ananatis]|uniref:7-cyano-7-deazaguanine synthase n=1 Tax=Pantoea ananas TaxID=553 RepID=UPI001302F0A8|nr:7-cyano-7-deazaguanine synthase [Pantoea ananatis]